MYLFRFFFASVLIFFSFLFSAQKRAIEAAGNEVPPDCILSSSEDDSDDEGHEQDQPGTSGISEGNEVVEVSTDLIFALHRIFR